MTAFFASRFVIRTLMTGVAVLSLASCGSGNKGDMQAASEPAEMTPPIAMAGEHGLKNDIYFDAELKEATTRLNGMKMKLDDLEDDLQGSTMAMQRVEAMREEIGALDARFRALQMRMGLIGDGVPPQLMPVTASTKPGEIISQKTTVTTMTVPADSAVSVTMSGLDMQAPGAEAAPTPLTASMGASHEAAPAVTTTTVTTTTPAPAAVPAAPAAAMKPVVETKKAEAAKPTLAASGAKGVQAVRVGTHDSTVRIVLDINGATQANTNLDTAEKILTVELPKIKWSAAMTQAVAKNPLVSSYTAQETGEGSIVAFALKGDTKLAGTSTLKAVDGKAARLVIDLKK